MPPTGAKDIDTQAQDAPDPIVAEQADDFGNMATDEDEDIDLTISEEIKEEGEKTPPEGEGEQPEGEPAAGEKPEEKAKPDKPAEEAAKPDEPDPKVEPPKVVEPEVEPAAQPIVEPPPAVPEPAQVPQPTYEETLQSQRDMRVSAEHMLATQHYNLSEEQVEEISESPAVALPKLMAKVYMDAVQGSANAMIARLPLLMQQVNQQVDIGRKNEDSFYEAWPELKVAADGATVHALATTYRASYPNASKVDFIQHVGAQAMVALGRAPGAARIPVPEAAATPAFVPAGGGKPAPGPGAKPPETNPFEALAEEFIEEDASGF